MPGMTQGLLAGGSLMGGDLGVGAATLGVPWAMARAHTSPALMRTLSNPAYGAAMDFVESQAPRIGLMGGLMMKDNTGGNK